MFTGLIRELGTVQNYSNSLLTITSQHKPKIGDSIAVNGACLTVVKVLENGFAVELSPETEKVIAVKNMFGKVHIEPAMRLQDRVEGHIVQGHIDTIGEILKIEETNNSKNIYIKLSLEFMKFIVPKGSITVDGVSLTINSVYKESFRLTIIPHTFKNTLFEEYKVGREVNIETDMFARYIYHMFKREKSLSWDEVDKIVALY